MMNRCEFLLIYLRRGIYAELVEHSEPLAEISDQGGKPLFVVRTLTMVESTLINKLVHLGLGVAINRTASTDDKSGCGSEGKTDSEPSTPSDANPSTSAATTVLTGDSPEPTLSTSSQTTTVDKIGADTEPVPSTSSQVSTKQSRTKSMSTENLQGISEYTPSKISIKLVKLTMGLTESVKVMTEMMENLPKSKYSTYDLDDTQDLNISEVDTHVTEKNPDISSNETEAYWPLDDDQGEMEPDRQMKQQPK